MSGSATISQSWRVWDGAWVVETVTPDPDHPRRRGFIDWYIIRGVDDPRVAEQAAIDLLSLPAGQEFFQCEDNRVSGYWPVIADDVRDRLVSAGMMESYMVYDVEPMYHANAKLVPSGLWKLTAAGIEARQER